MDDFWDKVVPTWPKNQSTTGTPTLRFEMGYMKTHIHINSVIKKCTKKFVTLRILNTERNVSLLSMDDYWGRDIPI